jgi:hypothetical protein
LGIVDEGEQLAFIQEDGYNMGGQCGIVGKSGCVYGSSETGRGKWSMATKELRDTFVYSVAGNTKYGSLYVL